MAGPEKQDQNPLISSGVIYCSYREISLSIAIPRRMIRMKLQAIAFLFTATPDKIPVEHHIHGTDAQHYSIHVKVKHGRFFFFIDEIRDGVYEKWALQYFTINLEFRRYILFAS